MTKKPKIANIESDHAVGAFKVHIDILNCENLDQIVVTESNDEGGATVEMLANGKVIDSKCQKFKP